VISRPTFIFQNKEIRLNIGTTEPNTEIGKTKYKWKTGGYLKCSVGKITVGEKMG
jgi:hypothetical protein